jgi:hypothetical protein
MSDDAGDVRYVVSLDAYVSGPWLQRFLTLAKQYAAEGGGAIVGQPVIRKESDFLPGLPDQLRSRLIRAGILDFPELCQLDEIDLFVRGLTEDDLCELEIALSMLESPLALADRTAERTLSSLPIEDSELALLREIGFDLDAPLAQIKGSALTADYTCYGDHFAPLHGVLARIVLFYELIGLVPADD